MSRHLPRHTVLALAMLSTCVSPLLVGCNHWRDVLREPGTERFQRSQASLHDPFPDTKMGPSTPELRPRDFQQPYAEPKKAQLWSELQQMRGVR